jgi:hypothetical protein
MKAGLNGGNAVDTRPVGGVVLLSTELLRERLQRVLEAHAEDERTLDAYWQWATNPTPPVSGYALEENEGFIATGLLMRYGCPAVSEVRAISDTCQELVAGGASIFELQQTIMMFLGGPLGAPLRDGIVRRLLAPLPGRRALAAWVKARAIWRAAPDRAEWTLGEFDWSLGQDLEAMEQDLQSTVAKLLFGGPHDLLREAIAVGIVNRLYYRSPSGRVEAKFRPGPRILVKEIRWLDE